MSLKICTVNVRSLIKRIGCLNQLLFDNNVDVLCVQETWISNNNPIFITGYNWVGTQPTKKKGRGIGILVRKSLKFTVEEISHDTNNVEIIIIRINVDPGLLKVGCVYIHPNTPQEELNELEFYLDSNIIMCGDFNAHHSSWSLGKSNPRGKNLKRLFKKNSMKVVKLRDSPTLFNGMHKRWSSPDLIVVGHHYRRWIKNKRVGRDIGSDHLPLLADVILVKELKVLPQRQHWLYDRCDIDKYKSNLYSNLKEWLRKVKICKELSIDVCYKEWAEIVIDSATRYCPRSSGKYRLPGNPWWDKGCEEAVRARHRARHAMQRRNDMNSYFAYKEQNKKTEKILRSAKSKYWQKITSKMNLEDTYRFIRRYGGRGKAPDLVIAENGNQLRDSKAIANNIGKFFSNCGKKIAGPGRPEFVAPLVQPDKQSCEDEDVITENEILEFISIQNLKKASGPDQIHPFMLKLAPTSVLESLVWLFNWIYKNSKSPESWFIATIIPIPKTKGSKVPIDSFRPISMTSVVGKIFERIINKRLLKICDIAKCIPEFQNGFRRGRSTRDNILRLQKEIHKAFDEKKILLTVFLDIKKAYDCVDRRILYDQLASLNLSPKLRKWLEHFLKSKRVARVQFGTERSNLYEFEYGVPQGSPLSPLLFNIYTMGLEKLGSKNVSQFADDMVIWEKDTNIEKATQIVNHRLYNLLSWSEKLNLVFSTKKCICVPFTRKRVDNDFISIRIDGNVLEVANSAKYLGLIFDRRLTWGQHIASINLKCEKRVFLIKKLSNQVTGINQKILINLYKTLVRPVIEYGAEAWGDASITNLRRLESIEHRMLASSLGVNRLSSRMGVLLESGILPIKYRRLLQMYKHWLKVRNKINWSDILHIDHSNKSMSKRRRSFMHRFEQFCHVASVDKNNPVPISIVRKRIFMMWMAEANLFSSTSNIARSTFSIAKSKNGYKPFTLNRELGALWHQARLGTLPLNEFLHTIKVAKTPRCVHCNTSESVEHVILACPIYKNLHNHPGTRLASGGLGKVLDLDNPPPVKRKVASFIKTVLKKRKTYLKKK